MNLEGQPASCLSKGGGGVVEERKEGVDITLCRYLKNSQWVEPGVWLSPTSKLNVKQLHKLGLRFIAMFQLNLGESATTATTTV